MMRVWDGDRYREATEEEFAVLHADDTTRWIHNWKLAKRRADAAEAALAEAEATIAGLRAALEAARISHYTCEDAWYDCPQSDERGGSCLRHDVDGDCGCGCTCEAEAHNASIDAAMTSSEPAGAER